MARTLGWSGAIFLIVSSLAGCSAADNSPPPPGGVKGKVTLDGQPLKEGQIFFVTLGEPPQILAIKDGAFEGEVTSGKRRVEIMAYKDGSPLNFLPDRYNSRSDLTADVTPDGPNDFQFDLQSQ